MATAVRASHLALICLAFIHHLSGATTGEPLLVHTRMNTTAATTTLPPQARIHLQATDAGRPTSSNSHHHLRASSPSASTPTAVSSPRGHDVPVIDHEDTATAPATTAPTPTPPAPPCPSVSAVRAEPSVDDILQAQRGITAPSRMAAALLKALPLLAIPFLPTPVAAVVALSSLATPVRACSVPSSDSCSGLTHGTCTVYRYHHDNGTVDRAEPFEKLRTVCPHPRCDAGSKNRALSTAYGRCRGRHDDPFHGYCSVRTLEVEQLPEGKAWRIMPVHLPVADPAAAGGVVCYVELEHMNYSEGYYIRCPVRDCRHVPVICCTEFPHDAIAAAVWEHRRVTYRDTVAWYSYTNGTARPKLEGLENHDEL